MLVLPFSKKTFAFRRKFGLWNIVATSFLFSPSFFTKSFPSFWPPLRRRNNTCINFLFVNEGGGKKRTHFPSWSFASKGGEKSEQMHTPTHIFCTQTRSNKCWAGAEKGERESALLCIIIHATPHPFPTPIAIPPTHRPTIIFLPALNEGVRRRRGRRRSAAEGAWLP